MATSPDGCPACGHPPGNPGEAKEGRALCPRCGAILIEAVSNASAPVGAEIGATHVTPILRRGELSLGFGLALLVAAAGLYPSVMVWMLGVMFVAPVAVLFLTLGVLRARGGAGSGTERALGFLLMIVGLVGLGYAATAGSVLSYRLGEPDARVSASWSVPVLMLRWVLPIPLLALGLRHWTDWSPRRRRRWVLVFLLVPLATLILHRTLVTTGLLPMSA